MEKTYQQVVKDSAEQIILSLKESGYFEEYEIEDDSFARRYLCDVLTEKFIQNGLDTYEGIFNEEEFETILKEICVGSLLEQLKEKKFVSSYEDENTEEVFFLTKEGKEYLKNNGFSEK
jgi:hypothetical protein